MCCACFENFWWTRASKVTLNRGVQGGVSLGPILAFSSCLLSGRVCLIAPTMYSCLLPCLPCSSVDRRFKSSLNRRVRPLVVIDNGMFFFACYHRVYEWVGLALISVRFIAELSAVNEGSKSDTNQGGAC